MWIKLTPTVKLPTLQTNQDLIALGEYFTRSKLKLKKHRKNTRPHNASTDIDYNKDTPSSGADKKPKRKRTNNKPPADGPSASRVGAQLTSTVSLQYGSLPWKLTNQQTHTKRMQFLY